MKEDPLTSTLIISGGPSRTSRTALLAAEIAVRLRSLDEQTSLLDLRTLPAEELLQLRVESPTVQAAYDQVARARGVVIATPVYKAAYTGLLKSFLDVLPQHGLRDKVVLPLATGGSMAHVLALDYAVGPVLQSLDALHVIGGLFVLDSQMALHEDGTIGLEGTISDKLQLKLESFVRALRRATRTMS